MSKKLGAALCAVCLTIISCVLPVSAEEKAAPSVDVDYEELAGELEMLAREEPLIVTNIYRMIAEAYQRREKPELAMAAYEKALRFSPADEGLLNVLSDLAREIGDAERSLRYAGRLVELHPGNIYYYQRLAAIYESLDQTDKVEALWEKALEANPDNPDFRRQLAENLAEKDDFENAVKEMEAALALEPANSWFLRLLARYQIELGDPRSGLASLREANAKSQDAWEKRDIACEAANSIARSGTPEEMLADFMQPIEQNTGDAFYYWVVGQVYVNEGERGKAIGVFEKAVRLIPAEREFVRQLVDLYQDTRDFDRAIALIQGLIDAEGESSDLYSRLADAYLAAGEYDRALEVYEKARALDPENLYFFERIADVYLRQNRPGEAIRQYEEIINRTADTWRKEDMEKRIQSIRERLADEAAREAAAREEGEAGQ
ncbi:MAG: tetratricopeptide repeat protein [Candidatus Omnitrophica bacterium]|nr:tetratricopeptide repeat protein [Candidatus Omnitrophota bacterium]